MGYPSFNDVVKAREKLKQTSYEHWVNEDLFSWQWWFLLAATILPWVVWLIMRDRKRTYELLTYGLLWAVIGTVSDVIGGEWSLWGYPDKMFGCILLSAIISYIVEPLFIKTHMFMLHHWSHTASFIGFILISPIIYVMVKKLGQHTATDKITP